MLFLGFVAWTTQVFGQSLNTYSPYSRIGIGIMSQPGFTQNRAMGGVSQALRSETLINFSNPASYSKRDSLSFLFDFGLETNTSSFTGYDQYLNPQTSRNSSGGIHHIAVSFPVSKKWGVAAGIAPYSFVGYKLLRFETDPLLLSTIGRIKYYHTGMGGFNQAFLGTAFAPIKNLSIGVNMLYYFGSLDYKNDIEFPITYNQYSNGYVKSSFQISDFNFSFGAQYKFLIDKESNTNVTLGVTYQLPKQMNMTQEWFATIEGAFVDSLYPHPERETSLKMPSSLNTGVAFTWKDKLILTSEYFTQDWSGITLFNSDLPMAKMESYRFGAELTPNKKDFKSYLKKINYRTGFYINKTNLIIGDEQIREYGITFGVGLPLKGKTRINVSMEIGKRGTDKNYLIKENFGAFNVSLSFYDYPWFFKRKYN